MKPVESRWNLGRLALWILIFVNTVHEKCELLVIDRKFIVQLHEPELQKLTGQYHPEE